MQQWACEVQREILLHLGCRRKKPPSEKTFRRVLGKLVVAEFEQRVGEWFARRTALEGRWLALDGKTVRGSADGETPATHLLIKR